MSVLKFPLLFVGSKGEKIMHTLFDDGAKFSCIHPDYRQDIADKQLPGRVRNIDLNNTGYKVEIKEAVTLDFFISNIHLSDEFFILPGMKETVIIGAPTIRNWRIKLNLTNNSVEVDPKLARLQLI